MEDTNFIQTGEQLKCGHCDEQYHVPELGGYICKCICHKPMKFNS